MNVLDCYGSGRG